MFSKTDISKGLRTTLVGKKFFIFDRIDSTNTCAKTLAEAGADEGSVVIAEYQTKGKGRFGRSWKAEPEKNLLFSILLRPQVKKDQSGLLTFYAATAVARAIESITGSKVECKWPNDLLINGKKVCGILIENSLVEDCVSYSVIGIGLNVNQKLFSDEIKDKATSLARELDHDIDRTAMLKLILEEIDKLYPDVKQTNYDFILKEWKERCTMFGKPITITQGPISTTGIALELSSDGGLVVETSNGIKTIHAGDVTLQT